jgi:Flp pilus assembly protein TadG
MTRSKARRNSLVHLPSDEQGSALVEATILLPFFIFLFLGLFEFCWFYYHQQLIEVGVRDAARYLSRTSIGNPCLQTTPPTDYVDNAKNIATTGTIDGTGTPRVQGWTTAGVTIVCALSNDTTDPFLGGTPWIITVTGQPTTDLSLGFFPILGLPPATVSFTYSHRNIGPG